eukprot:CAMPEP_0172915998 /NCGR_PEP_ID=MMETSP1075-20121228/195352_1 /TAXON_ID=2916 /ORGANISM="Ceratium fusus, Strain PA161109" /LENGTH=502 /DNA_ID=CAMNT_0013775181 /DNA_START=73 /DNA_END=1580 /DNA_ORIENTATION=+
MSTAFGVCGLGGPMLLSTLTLPTLPKHVTKCEYAGQGPVRQKAEELARQLMQQQAGSLGRHTGMDADPLPFDKIVPCSVGNPQAVGQQPVQFHRQVMACLIEPLLMQKNALFQDDVLERASRYLSRLKDGATGAYSSPQGHLVFREEVASYLSLRDETDTSVDDVFLTDGASAAIKMVLQLILRGSEDGILLPIPQYPLYSAMTVLLGGQPVGYFLDEQAGWNINVDELQRAAAEFRKRGGVLRAIVVINPGNPTGQVLSQASMEAVIHFAEQESLVILADEVYQDNIHTDGKEFMSFRRLAHQMGTAAEVFSFHSISKGFMGESGLRGGFVHCSNLRHDVRDQLRKIASISLCSNVVGQALVASAVTPPPLDGASRASFDQDRAEIKGQLQRKAKLVWQRLNALDGISCQPLDGAIYAFPRVTIKGYIMKKAISFATPADEIYCLELLERTGVVTVPGSGFGQKPGTFHFRMTILPDEDVLSGVLDSIERFHGEHAAGWFR